MTIQVPSIILPRVWTTGLEMEWINDLVTHVSIEFSTEHLIEKQVRVMAYVSGGVPGNLLAWIELSPVPSTTSALYWAAIGGGGGLLPAVAPTVIVLTGALHTFMLPWSIHAPYARLVVQSPVNAGLPAMFWIVQAVIDGQAL